MTTPSGNSRTTALAVWIATGALIGSSLLAGCAATGPANPDGRAPIASDPGQPGLIRGVGIEGHDIISMADGMMRDMLANARLTRLQGGRVPRVIIDARYFENDSSQPINRNLITDRLRVNLNRSAQGRLTFVGRQYADAVEAERARKKDGQLDIGSRTPTQAAMGADFRLGGRIASIDQRASNGLIQRYTQIAFEMFDLDSSEIVWSGLYEFQRTAADDAVYR